VIKEGKASVERSRLKLPLVPPFLTVNLTVPPFISASVPVELTIPIALVYAY
jgi:hypothetical protein